KGRTTDQRLAELAAHRRDPAWREVLLLLGEAMASETDLSCERENQLMDHVLTLMRTKRHRERRSLWDWDGWWREDALATKLVQRPAFRELLPEMARNEDFDQRWRIKAIEWLAASGQYDELVRIALD